MKQYLTRWYLMLFLTTAACCLPTQTLRSEAVYAPQWLAKSFKKTPKSKHQHTQSPRTERRIGILFLTTTGLGFWTSLFFILFLLSFLVSRGIGLASGLILGGMFLVLAITVLSIIYSIYYIDNSYYIYAADKQVAWARKRKHLILGWILSGLF